VKDGNRFWLGHSVLKLIFMNVCFRARCRTLYQVWTVPCLVWSA